jgi:hypothetical protein
MRRRERILEISISINGEAETASCRNHHALQRVYHCIIIRIKISTLEHNQSIISHNTTAKESNRNIFSHDNKSTYHGQKRYIIDLQYIFYQAGFSEVVKNSLHKYIESNFLTRQKLDL